MCKLLGNIAYDSIENCISTTVYDYITNELHDELEKYIN